jgi:hypothetical protein
MCSLITSFLLLLKSNSSTLLHLNYKLVFALIKEINLINLNYKLVFALTKEINLINLNYKLVFALIKEINLMQVIIKSCYDIVVIRFHNSLYR